MQDMAFPDCCLKLISNSAGKTAAGYDGAFPAPGFDLPVRKQGVYMYDIIIIGAGPAGLTAALYARRAGKSVLVVEKDTFGGQMTFSPKIENYPCVKEISGNQLADLLVEQVLEQGADIEPDEVLSIEKEESFFSVVCRDSLHKAKAVIIAAGARHRRLGLDGEEKLVGHGVSFCAVCDGAFYKDRRVAVVGGGNSALQEAVLLSDTASHVTLVQNLDFFTGEQQLLRVLEQRKNVDFVTGTVVSGFESAGGELTALLLTRVSDGAHSVLPVDGAFVAIGLEPVNGAFENVARLDKSGYFDSGEDCATGTPGVFVAGDCRRKSVRQITTAAADGSSAAVAACRYVDSL